MCMQPPPRATVPGVGVGSSFPLAPQPSSGESALALACTRVSDLRIPSFVVRKCMKHLDSVPAPGL